MNTTLKLHFQTPTGTQVIDIDDACGVAPKDILEQLGCNEDEATLEDFESPLGTFPLSLYKITLPVGFSDVDEDFWYELGNQKEFFDMDESNLVLLHNERCDLDRDESIICDLDDEFFDTYFENKPYEAVRATLFGQVNLSDDYVTFNGYGNLESFNSLDDINSPVDMKGLLEFYLNN